MRTVIFFGGLKHGEVRPVPDGHTYESFVLYPGTNPLISPKKKPKALMWRILDWFRKRLGMTVRYDYVETVRPQYDEIVYDIHRFTMSSDTRPVWVALIAGTKLPLSKCYCNAIAKMIRDYGYQSESPECSGRASC